MISRFTMKRQHMNIVPTGEIRRGQQCSKIPFVTINVVILPKTGDINRP